MYSMIKRLYSVAVKGGWGWAGDTGLPDSAAETPIRASRNASYPMLGWGESWLRAGGLRRRRRCGMKGLEREAG